MSLRDLEGEDDETLDRRRSSSTRLSSTDVRPSLTSETHRSSTRARGGESAPTLLGLPNVTIPVLNREVPLAIILGALLATALLMLVIANVGSCVNSRVGGTSYVGVESTSDEDVQTTVEVAAPVESRVVTFCAVGDNLANNNINDAADAWGGEGAGDGIYDYTPLYRDIKPIVSGFDVAFINQETTMGDYSYWGAMGYPSYNTPTTMALAVADTGFDVVNCNTNHTYDTWVDSILYSQQVWAQYPQVKTIGSYSSEADRANTRVVERNGLKLAFLSYCYGQNAYEWSDLPNDYYAVPFDETGLRQDYARARQVADVVIVYMHGGTEYTNQPDEWQMYVAQSCADLGVDLVIGSHAHVIQPMAWLNRADGSGQMLCVYGMGDFVSGYDSYPDTILSGMFSCTFSLDEADKVRIDNIVWTPLIEHWVYDENWVPDDRVCLVRDYSPEMAAANVLLASQPDAYEWMRNKSREVIGDGFTIDM